MIPRTNAAGSIHPVVADLAIDLDLTALAQALPEILDRAENESLSFIELALALLRAESTARRNRSLTRILKRSRLGTVEGLEGYGFAIRPQLDVDRLVDDATILRLTGKGCRAPREIVGAPLEDERASARTARASREVAYRATRGRQSRQVGLSGARS